MFYLDYAVLGLISNPGQLNTKQNEVKCLIVSLRDVTAPFQHGI